MNDTTEKVIESLKYIAESPAPEHGGFHANTVQIAKDALVMHTVLTAEVERLRTALRDIRDMPEIDQDNEHRLRNKAGVALGKDDSVAALAPVSQKEEAE